MLAQLGMMAAGGATGAAQGAVQNKQNKNLMELQAKLNERAADANQERNKEMWDYTNYGNQRKHMEDAGLNVGLMYGQGGAGGGTAGGAQAQGVGLQKSEIGNMSMQGQAMGLQMNMQKKQVDNIAAETEGVKIENEIKEVELKNKEKEVGLNLQGTQLDNDIKNLNKEYAKFNNEIAEQNKYIKSEELRTANAKAAQEEINKNIMEELWMDGTLQGITREQLKELKEKIKHITIQRELNENDLEFINSFKIGDTGSAGSQIMRGIIQGIAKWVTK